MSLVYVQLPQFVRIFGGTSPDIHVNIDDIIAEGDKVVVCNIRRATDATTGDYSAIRAHRIEPDETDPL